MGNDGSQYNDSVTIAEREYQEFQIMISKDIDHKLS